MKRVLKSSLSLLLAITIILSSAYVGLAEVDFDGLFVVGTNAASTDVLTFALNSDGISYSVVDCDIDFRGDIIIPNTYNGLPVTGIDGAFAGCWHICSVTIPASVISINPGEFYACESLQEIIVDEDNPNYSSENGVLFNKNKTVLIRCPIGLNIYGGYVVLDTVKSIDYMAFFDCGFEAVTIPGSVSYIGELAFYGCSALSDIYYKDTQVAWGKITIGAYNEDLLNATIHYTEIIPTDYLTYELNSNGKAYNLTSCDTSASGDIVIPATYNGLPIVYIDSYAFRDCNVDSVTVSDSVVNISNLAFYKCNLKKIIVDENNPDYSSENGVLFNKNKTNLLRCPTAFSGEFVVPDTVTNIGMCAFSDCEKLNAITIPECVTYISYSAFENCKNLTSVSIPKGIKTIPSDTFRGCASLATITIPEDVTSIGSSAFAGCTSLTSITIPEGVMSIDSSVFSDCDSLTSISIPDSVTSIGSSAFAGCASLATITIPEDVMSIGSSAFAGCTRLTSISIPERITNIGEGTFYNCSSLTSFSIPDGVTNIGNSAFEGCTSLDSITIPKSVTSIGVRAFSDCTNLTTIINSASITNIDDCTFYNCTALTSINIPESVTNIGLEAFYNCTELASIEIPESVTSIGCSAFEGCTSLTSITIPKGLISIDDYTFCNCASLKSITIPEGVTSIGFYTFSDCTNLTSITLPESLTSIGDGAFFNCTSLTDITIPGGVSSIGASAFWACESLTSVTIIDGVNSIGASAFWACNSLLSIKIPGSVTTISDGVFPLFFNGTIYCEKDSTSHKYAVDNNIKYLFMYILDTLNSQIDYAKCIIKTNVQACDNIADVLGVSDSARIVITVSCEQGSNELLGTGTIISVYERDAHIGDYTLVVNGDTNGDSVCDALDAAQVALVSNGQKTIDGAYKMAADSNSDDIVDINDYQAIVNKVVA